MRCFNYVVLVSLILALTGCAPDISANHYNADQAQKVSEVRHGVITSESQVQVDGSKGNWAGPLIGGAAGAVLGSAIGGGGVGTGLATVGGAAVGGYAGNKTEGALSKQEATRYIIKLANGDSVAVVQKDNPPLSVGTKVQVISGDPAQVVVDN